MAFARLKHIVISDLPALKKVGSGWLRFCDKLESGTIERLPQLQSVGEFFLAQCRALKHVSFKDLPELTTVQHAWLNRCEKLIGGTFENLPKLENVVSTTLGGCPCLTGFERINVSKELEEYLQRWDKKK